MNNWQPSNWQVHQTILFIWQRAWRDSRLAGCCQPETSCRLLLVCQCSSDVHPDSFSSAPLQHPYCIKAEFIPFGICHREKNSLRSWCVNCNSESKILRLLTQRHRWWMIHWFIYVSYYNGFLIGMRILPFLLQVFICSYSLEEGLYCKFKNHISGIFVKCPNYCILLICKPR